MGRAKERVDPAHPEADMESRVVVLKVMRHMRPRHPFPEPALWNPQMRERVAVFVEGKRRDRPDEDCHNRKQERPIRPDNRPEHEEVCENRDQPELERIPVVAAREKLRFVGEFVVADMATVERVEHGLLCWRVTVVKEPMHHIFNDELHHCAVNQCQDQDR
mgnify:CR=1 FL=1